MDTWGAQAVARGWPSQHSSSGGAAPSPCHRIGCVLWRRGGLDDRRQGPAGGRDRLTPATMGAHGRGRSGPVVPHTLRRTGGIAGFDDTIVLRANGQILVETRTVRGARASSAPHSSASSSPR